MTIISTTGAEDGEVLHSQQKKKKKKKRKKEKKRPRSDYGSNHQFLIAKFRLKLTEVRKTTRPFRMT